MAPEARLQLTEVLPAGWKHVVMDLPTGWTQVVISPPREICDRVIIMPTEYGEDRACETAVTLIKALQGKDD